MDTTHKASSRQLRVRICPLRSCRRCQLRKWVGRDKTLAAATGDGIKAPVPRCQVPLRACTATKAVPTGARAPRNARVCVKIAVVAAVANTFSLTRSKLADLYRLRTCCQEQTDARR